MSRETTFRHLWLAGLGAMARLRRSVDRIAGRTPIAEEPPADAPFVTTEKVAKRRSTHSSGSRRAGEHEAKRRMAGKGR